MRIYLACLSILIPGGSTANRSLSSVLAWAVSCNYYSEAWVSRVGL